MVFFRWRLMRLALGWIHSSSGNSTLFVLQLAELLCQLHLKATVYSCADY